MRFFSDGNFPSCLCCNFFRTNLYSEKLLLALFQSKHFDKIVTFLEQLCIQSICFFLRTPFLEQLLLCISYLFQNSYFFREKLLPINHFFRRGSSLGKILFGTATFLVEEKFRIKISTEELFSKGIFPQPQLFKNSYFLEKANLSGKKEKPF